MAFVYAEPGVAREHILRASGAPVRRGRRAALVASAERTRRAHALLRRSRLAAVRRRSYVRVTGDATVLDEVGAVHHDAPARAARARDLRPAAGQRRDGDRVRALPARAAQGVCTIGRARAAADRHRRLERRNESRRRRGQGRERVARLVPRRHAARLRRARRARAAMRTSAASSARQADAYAEAVEANGWDGEWYRRAYFDDGTPLGSRTSDECQIDSIAQSWSVISGAGDPARRHAARWRRSSEHLVRDDARLIMLLTPPFDQIAARSGIHQGLSARRARERRAVHARRALGRAGDGAAAATATARSSCIR